ncbi:hypothetical protein SCNU_13989 [Gordonia neofelifaecis NRRL B-59395]|uniref:Glyoxalase/Bleomycin resistance-like N-terminal domain-containing protein n=1 Tax=Gordonia neofelifaecis NRRL B-59395 TaxID=644548 RepID=F1YLK6_9ACTN|nr:hypothetical protein SCNU_13989 [Gordonia neofelifaecis NRRL B-59395]
MHKMIFVNLPVADLDASREFFGELGYSFDERFTDENAAALVLGETIVAMLLKRDFYQTFVPGKTIIDAKSTSGAILCLSAESRDEVTAIVDKAVAGGAPHRRQGGGGGCDVRRHRGPRIHVRQLVLRPRRPRLGDHVDGSRRRRSGTGGLRCPAGRSVTERC